MRSTTTFQRLALATLVVCLAAFIGTRLVRADHHPVTHHDAVAEEVHLGVDLSGLDIDVEVNVDEEVRVALTSMPSDVLYERSFPVRAGDRLELHLSSEDVVVEPVRGGQASVTVEGRGRDAREEFERRRFSAEYGGGRLHVRTNPERRRGLGNVRASFTVTVRVPASIHASVNVSSGDVRLADLEGELTVNASSGDVVLGDVRRGDVTITTSSGDVQGGDLAGESVRIRTSSGDVSLHAVRAQRLTVSASSGDVEVRRVEADVAVETGSGDVVLGFDGFRGLRTTTGSGDVEATLPRGTGAEVAIDSPDIDIDDALDFRGSTQRRSVQGRLGSGGPALRVDTGSGSVTIGAR